MRFAPIQFENLDPYQKFVFMGGNDFLYSNLNLDENSKVLVIGVYKGYSSLEITLRYKCKIYAFEPVADFLQIAESKLRKFNNVRFFNLGINSRPGEFKVHLNKDASTLFAHDNSENVECNFVDIEFLYENIGADIDLVEINIEGGEYEILSDLIGNPKIIVKQWLIQFHDIDENSKIKRDEIREMLLSKNYLEVFSFDFVWERWESSELDPRKREIVQREFTNAFSADLICIERGSF